ncbi:MAG TPA: sulfatase-like hydrolase/transferase [Planctomycetota bacterium]|jgi:arylsulfatase A-like enzyme|nr:sulfatase-like hydrolase/transferase [Planctomycetota bacterium]
MNRRLVAAALALLGACHRSAPLPPRNAILATFDTTRADRLAPWGGKPDVAPRLERLAREGAVFETAFSPVPETLPSHTTLLTGLLPPAHGVRVNGTPLPGKVRTIAQVLSEAGFATAAVVGAGVLDPGFGLRRGFDLYDREFLQAERPDAAERRAEEVNAVALEWLRRQDPGRRFFLWVHYYDPHDPYDPPSPFAERFRGRPYEGEIAYADACLGRLLDAAREAGRLDGTLVCAAADHGEGLGEHGELYHSVFLYDSTVRVPLLFWDPGRIPAARIRGVVSLLDVAPTLLDLLGLPVPSAMAGRSLAPSFATGAIDAAGPCYMEANHGAGTYGWAPLRALRTADWKFVRAPRPELYRLRDDPGEARNLLAEEPERVAGMDRTLRAVEERAGSLGETSPPEPEAGRLLAALGYAGSAFPEGPPSDRDPKDRVWEVAHFYRARDLAEKKRYREALEELEPVLEKDPANPEAAFLAGELSWNAGDLSAAEARLARCLELKPDYPNARTLHGIVAAQRGDVAAAEDRFREALRRAPTFSRAKLNYAVLLLNLGRSKEAEPLLRDYVRQRPNAFDGWELLGRLLAVDPSRREEAVSTLERALAVRPGDAEIAGLLRRLKDESR